MRFGISSPSPPAPQSNHHHHHQLRLLLLRFPFSSASASSSSSFRHVFCGHFAARCGPNCIGMMVAMPDQHRGELRVFCRILVRHSHHHAYVVGTTSGCEKVRTRTSLQGATFCPNHSSLACRRRYRPKVGLKSRAPTILKASKRWKRAGLQTRMMIGMATKRRKQADALKLELATERRKRAAFEN